MTRREHLPYAPTEHLEDGSPNPMLALPPVWGGAESSLQALMEASPFTSPITSTEESLPLRDAIQDAIDQLPPLERAAFDGFFVGRYTVRQLADMLGVSKSTAHRLKDQAVSRLRIILEGNVLVQERIVE